MKPNHIVTSNGSTYYRRRLGQAMFTRRLPDPSSARFRRAYDAAARQWAMEKNPLTTARLVDIYQKDDRYRNLKASTQRVKDHHLRVIVDHYGDLLVSEITRHDVFDLQREFSTKPGTALCLVKEMCALLNFAVDRGYIKENVARNINKHRAGELRAWPDHVIEKAISAAKPMLRLAIITALESGQRISDWICITHDQVASGLVELKQLKTGTQVYIPVSQRWLDAIADVPKKAPTLLYNKFNKSFRTSLTLQNEIRFLMRDIGEPGWTFHGLRRNCTNRLAMRGASLHEISAITGMTLPTVMYYTRDIDRRRLARQVAARAAGHNLPADLGV